MDILRLKNQFKESGTSLFELVIALGVSGIIAVFVADLMTEQSHKTQLAQITSEINAQHDVMQKTLRNKEACSEILNWADEIEAFTNADGKEIQSLGRKNSRTDNTIVGIGKGNKGKYEITSIVVRNSPLNAFVKRFVITYTIPNKKIIDSDKTIVKTIDVLAEQTGASGIWKCGNLVENSRKESTRQMCLSLGSAATWVEDVSNVENYDCVLNEFDCKGTNVPVALPEFGRFECKPAKDVVDMTDLVDPATVDCTNKPLVSLITNGTKLKLSCTGTPPASTCEYVSTVTNPSSVPACTAGSWYTYNYVYKDAGGDILSSCYVENGGTDCKGAGNSYATTCMGPATCPAPPATPPTCTPAAEWDNPQYVWDPCVSNSQDGTRTKTCGNTAPAAGCPNNCTGPATETISRSCTSSCTPTTPPMEVGHCCGQPLVYNDGTSDQYPVVCPAGQTCWCQTAPPAPACPYITKPSCPANPNVYEAGYDSTAAPTGCNTSDPCTDQCISWGSECQNTLNCRYKMVGSLNCVMY